MSTDFATVRQPDGDLLGAYDDVSFRPLNFRLRGNDTKDRHRKLRVISGQTKPKSI